jgi:hypothetical protein
LTSVPPRGGQVLGEGVNSLRFAVRESALRPAFPHGQRPRGGSVADRVHLQRPGGAARRTDDALLPAGEVRLGAFTENLLVQHVRGRPPLGRRLLRSISGRARVTGNDIPGRERRLPPGVVAGVLAPRGR